jgi:hypothetical protein
MLGFRLGRKGLPPRLSGGNNNEDLLPAKGVDGADSMVDSYHVAGRDSRT